MGEIRVDQKMKRLQSFVCLKETVETRRWWRIPSTTEPPMQHNPGLQLHSLLVPDVVYPLGTQLVYRCLDGFEAIGFHKSMCVGEGRWVGPKCPVRVSFAI